MWSKIVITSYFSHFGVLFGYEFLHHLTCFLCNFPFILISHGSSFLNKLSETNLEVSSSGIFLIIIFVQVIPIIHELVLGKSCNCLPFSSNGLPQFLFSNFGTKICTLFCWYFNVFTTNFLNNTTIYYCFWI